MAARSRAPVPSSVMYSAIGDEVVQHPERFETAAALQVQTDRLKAVNADTLTARDVLAASTAVHHLGDATARASHKAFAGGVLPTASDFVKALRELYGGGGGAFDFAAFGRDTAHLCLDVPRARVMLGPLGVAPKARKVPQKAAAAAKPPTREAAIAAAGAAVRPTDDAEAVKKAADTRTENRTQALYKALDAILQRDGRPVKCVDGKQRVLVPLVQALFNPFSYSQTIENLFYFSALVKGNKAAVYMGDAPVEAGASAARGGAAAAPPGRTPYIRVFEVREFNDYQTGRVVERSAATAAARAAPSGERTAVDSDLTQQLVVHIDADSWRAMVDAYGLTVPLLPHRRSRDSCAPAGYACSGGTDDDEAADAGAAAAARAPATPRGAGIKRRARE